MVDSQEVWFGAIVLSLGHQLAAISMNASLEHIIVLCPQLATTLWVHLLARVVVGIMVMEIIARWQIVPQMQMVPRTARVTLDLVEYLFG